MLKRRRDDVQGFRGWAVILVILSIYYPKYFPNGNIGIDIYFVSSGFLTAMLLKSEGTLNLRTIGKFYQKRAHRIFPLYFLAVILILLVTMIGLPTIYRDNTMETAKLATMFVPKFQDDPTYCPSNIVAEDLLSHFWSICVEVQFHALIPLIFFIQQKFLDHEFLTFSIILLFSLIFHLFTRGTILYFSVFSRLWQFVAGVLAFLATIKWPINVDFVFSQPGKKLDQTWLNNTNEANENLTTTIGGRTHAGFGITVCLISPLFIAFLPFPLDVIELRLSVTLLTALVIYLNCENVLVYCNSFIIYIGDISFLLYLAHLPVFSFVEMYYDYIICPFPLGLMVCFMLAIIFEQFVENMIRSLSSIYSLTISAFFFLIAVVLSYKH